MSTVERIALDGSVVTLAHLDDNWNKTFRSDCRLLPYGGAERELCSGSLAHADWIANEPDFGAVTFREEYDFQGGTLRVGSGPSPKTPDGAEYMYLAEDGTRKPVERWLGVWYGKNYSLHSQAEGGPDKAQSLLSIFDQLILSEQPGGLTVQVAGHSQAQIYGLAVTQQIPGWFLLDISPLGPDQARSLPSWEGTRVRGGELFRASHEAHGEEHTIDHDYLVLVTETAVVTVTPLHLATEATLVAFASNLEASWAGTAQAMPARARARWL
jgi:hypothetical protein